MFGSQVASLLLDSVDAILLFGVIKCNEYMLLVSPRDAAGLIATKNIVCSV
jgi:hypothetical protein